MSLGQYEVKKAVFFDLSPYPCISIKECYPKGSKVVEVVPFQLHTCTPYSNLWFSILLSPFQLHNSTVFYGFQFFDPHFQLNPNGGKIFFRMWILGFSSSQLPWSSLSLSLIYISMLGITPAVQHSETSTLQIIRTYGTIQACLWRITHAYGSCLHHYTFNKLCIPTTLLMPTSYFYN